MNRLITRRRVVLIAAAVGLVVAIIIVAAIMDAHVAEVSLKPAGMSQQRFENEVKTQTEAKTGMRATRVGCGSFSATKWECFVMFANQKESIVIVTRRPMSILIDSVGTPRRSQKGAP